jgi:hypothetical protein
MMRSRDDRGAATVTAIVLMFSFSAVAVVWLARDVDRALSNRSAAQAIAFQAARAGAQQVDVEGVRAGRGATVPVHDERAVLEARRAAHRLFESYGVDGTVTDVSVRGDRVTVLVEVRDAAGVVTGTGSARAVERP